MAVSEDLINFDLIETHKENIQSLPGGRSARQLVSILSPIPSGKASSLPTLDETKTLNDAIRQEYELELQSIAESDDPLDIYDRYVKWTLNAYPSAQATAQSKLLPLLERATKAFLSSTHYKNDPRYLKLWLHYIRFFSDSPRETFAFLARHHIGEGLGLFYEEFAAWLEGAERWTQAEEVYKLGIEREARPAERLLRKYTQFQKRFESRPQNADGPSSPALPTMRPALAAKIDPFASTPRPDEPQAHRPGSGVGGAPSLRTGKPKMAIFSDAKPDRSQPMAGTETKGWDSIGSLHERKKENTIAARPWAGETLKAGKRVGTEPKMAIFKDQTTQAHESRAIQNPHLEPVPVNPKTGKAERVYVNLEAVYPNANDSADEFSFEELRAIHRGWAARDWRKRTASPLRAISINIQPSPPQSAKAQEEQAEELGLDVRHNTILDGENSSQIRPLAQQQQLEVKDTKPAKTKRLKVREIKQEAQTVQTKLESPTGPKLRRKISTEPTMTFHSKAATDEVYSMFNQPSRHEAAHNDSDEEEDDDYSAAGESTGTGRISATTSNFGDEDTIASVGTTGDENTRTDSQPGSVSPWSEFTASKHVPNIRGGMFRKNITAEATEDVSSSQNQTQTSQMCAFDTQAIAAIAGQQIGDFNTQVIAAMAGDFGEDEEKQVATSISPARSEQIEVRNTPKYIPLPPEDYEPTSLRPFRDPVEIAQNRLPFMTPIVEKTESSLAPSTILDNKEQSVSETPSPSNHLPVTIDKSSSSRLQIDELTLSSPTKGNGSLFKRKLSAGAADLQRLTSSLQKPKSNSPGNNPSIPGKSGQQVFAVTQPKFVKSSSAGSTNGVAKSAPAKGPIILDLQCNPVDPSIRQQILASTHPPLSSLPGFFDNSDQRSGKYPQIQNFAKKLAAAKPKASPRKNQTEKAVAQAVQPLLAFNGSSRIYAIKRELGKGAYAPVYLVDSHNRDCTDDGDNLHLTYHQNHSNKRSNLEAIKTEDPPSAWEFHILRLLRHRLGHMSRTMKSIILAHECHIFADECFLVLEYRSQGTLLDLVNVVKEENRKAGKPSADVGLDEVLAMFLSVELLRTVEECHAVGLLHGDLKADNCLCRFDGGELQEPYQRDGSSGWDAKGITLIDFGRGIDIRAFKPEAKFVADWASSAQDCAEIREARPWTWQIDYFGCAGVIHSLLFGRYIETVQVAGGGLGEKKEWKLKEAFKRYWAHEIWGEVFGLLLNPTMVGEGMPCLREMRKVREGMECWLEEEGERKALRGAVRRAEGLMNGRRK